MMMAVIYSASKSDHSIQCIGSALRRNRPINCGRSSSDIFRVVCGTESNALLKSSEMTMAYGMDCNRFVAVLRRNIKAAAGES
jgi:hypothetical protein